MGVCRPHLRRQWRMRRHPLLARYHSDLRTCVCCRQRVASLHPPSSHGRSECARACPGWSPTAHDHACVTINRRTPQRLRTLFREGKLKMTRNRRRNAARRRAVESAAAAALTAAAAAAGIAAPTAVHGGGAAVVRRGGVDGGARLRVTATSSSRLWRDWRVNFDSSLPNASASCEFSAACSYSPHWRAAR